jgi:hypothetical protein
MPIRDDAYTNPETIRATYAARGRSRGLNIAKAESLGVNASQISATPGRGSQTGAASLASGGGGAGSSVVAAPVTIYTMPTDTYVETNYETFLYTESYYYSKIDSKELLL